MKKIIAASVLAASSLLAANSIATAAVSVATTAPVVQPSQSMQKQHRGGGNYKGAQQNGEHNKFAQLNLSATQQAQIQSIMQAKKDARQASREAQKSQRTQTQQQIQALANSPTLNNSTLNSLADQQAAKAKQRFIERVQTQHAIAQVLTPEQRQQMAQLKAQGYGKGYRGQK